jgi:hypothetical protein
MTSKATQEERIFGEALKFASEAERRTFLDQACHGNGEQHLRLELLLEGHFKAQAFLAGEPQMLSTGEEEEIGRLISLQAAGGDR